MGTPELISPRSPRVTAARRLARRAFRGKECRFIAEGPQAVREAIAHRRDGVPTLIELFATVEAAERHAEIVEAAHAAGVRVHFADDRTVADISQTVTPRACSASAASSTRRSRRSSRPARS